MEKKSSLLNTQKYYVIPIVNFLGGKHICTAQLMLSNFLKDSSDFYFTVDRVLGVRVDVTSKNSNMTYNQVV